MNIQKVFLIIGIVFLFLALLWPVIVKLPLFRLPGDIVIEKPNFKFYFPITSMILLSILISLILWFFKKFFGG